MTTDNPRWNVHLGDCIDVLRALDGESVQTCVTSPPYYGLRDYGHEGQIGLEPTPTEYVERLVAVFREVRRVLREDGTLWLNLGDSYGGPKGNNRSGCVARPKDDRGAALFAFDAPVHGIAKNLLGIPWRVAFALQADGWYLRQDIIWHKPNPMPESVRDRCTKAHEYVFLLTKGARYFYDAGAIAEEAAQPIGTPRLVAQHKQAALGSITATSTLGTNEGANTRNRRSVWTVPSQPFDGAHFAVMPEALVEPCILAGSRRGDTVLDPFTGSGTVGAVALRHGRHFIGAELNPEYAALARQRIAAAEGTTPTTTTAPDGTRTTQLALFTQ